MNIHKYSLQSFPYLIGKELGYGAFGQVFLGKRQQHIVLIKIQTKAIDFELKALERVKGVDHVSQIEDAFQIGGRYGLVLTLTPGFDLHQLIELGIRPDLELVREYIVQLGNALKDIHQLNVTHRDIKLENIVCQHSISRFTLIDFGNANVDSTNTTYRGTMGYQSPEINESFTGVQFEVECRCDVFALIVTLYLWIHDLKEPFGLKEEQYPLHYHDFEDPIPAHTSIDQLNDFLDDFIFEPRTVDELLSQNYF